MATVIEKYWTGNKKGNGNNVKDIAYTVHNEESATYSVIR